MRLHVETVIWLNR